MIIRASERKEKEEVLDQMEPLIAEWFDSKFDYLTEPQGYAIPLIHKRKNVLVSSPTGSGKTLTAFLSIINELFILDKEEKLENKIYCVYVSPLKALANDIRKNLERPLQELRELAKEEDKKIPNITTAIRSGDTPQSERRKMVKDPPHILITTPESLALVLSSPRFREKFDDVQYFIMDEIHDISSNKRGSYLSLNVERLEEHVKGTMTRVGLSATQAPIEEIARFLGGYENGKPREVNIIEVMGEKRMDLSVLSPVEDMTLLPYEVVNARMYDLLKEKVEEHRTTLIFTNTRSGAENVSYKLQERGIRNVAAHHGSLSKDTRINVEDMLKDGDLDAAVSSTSLELGIDVGYIDLVIQVGSPKSVAKGLQRIGRAGHAVEEESKGRMIVFEKDDLVECAVLTNQAYSHEIDRVNIPENNLDVLAQAIVGMSLEKRWEIEDVYKLIKRSHCFRNLSRKDFENTLDYLSDTYHYHVYPKIWCNKKEGVLGKKGGAQMIYYLNVGTIPSDSSYRVYSQQGAPLGSLSEKFVERLSYGDVFILGGRSYEFIDTKGTRVFVRDASGKKPTVPSWSGEMLPRSFDLSMAIARFRRSLSKKMIDEDKDIIEWLREEFKLDYGSAQTILSYFKEQLSFTKAIPTDKRLVLEGYIDEKDRFNIIFHACFGRRVNDALSRAYAYAISRKFNCSTRVAVNDDSFMVTTNKKMPLEEVVGLIRVDNVESILKRGVRNTELFKQRFRHCASRAFMILRNYKGRDYSVSKQKMRSVKILDTLREYDDFPIIKETYNEILYQVLDLKNAKQVLKSIEDHEVEVVTMDYSDTPSPFAHNIVMVGISDVIMMEDKSALLRQFHQSVLEKVIPKEEIEKFQFDRKDVEEHFFKKRPSFDNKEDMLEVIEEVGPVHVFREQGNHLFLHTERSYEEVRRWGRELLNDGKIRSIWIKDTYQWLNTGSIDSYLSTLDQGDIPHGAKPILESIENEPKTAKEIYRDIDLRLKDIKNILREMERRRRINRQGIDEEGDFRFGSLSLYDVDMEKVEEIILDFMEYTGPRSMEEIAYALSMPEDRALVALNNLMDAGRIVSGKLVLGEGTQYMLQEDYHDLRFPGEEYVSERAVSSYRAEKLFKKRDSIKKYFEDFVEASTSYDVFLRVEDFSLNEWGALREKDDLMEGRFLRGRVRYILSKDLNMFVGCYRVEALDREEENILELIKKGEANSLRELKNEADVDPERVKEIVKKLDKNLYIVRKFTGDEGWSSKNVYRAVDIEPMDRDKAKKELILRLLKAHGPVSLSDLRYMTGFRRRVVESILSSEVISGDVIKIMVGPSQRELYLMENEIDYLRSASKEDYEGLHILSRKDPYARPLWADIFGRYGDDYVFPIIKKSSVRGGVERWKMSGCIEVRHLDLDDISLIEESIDALDMMMDFHKKEGYDVLRIRHVNNKTPSEMDSAVLKEFIDNGYKLIQDMLVKGNVEEEVYSQKELRMMILRRQHLLDKQFSDVDSALKILKGARSEEELRERTQGTPSLRWKHRRGKVIKGKMVPPYVLYCYPEDAGVYRDAKNLVFDNVKEDILKITKDNQPVSKRTIGVISPYIKSKTFDSLNELYEGSVICQNAKGEYLEVPSSGLTEYDAKKKVVKWAFNSFGVFTAERLSYYLGNSFKMSDIRLILSDLVEDGYLSKGFFRKGDDTLRWIISDDLEDLDFLKCNTDKKFIITPKDRLNIYFREDIKDTFESSTFYVVFDGTRIVAGFSAKIRSGRLHIDEFKGPSKYMKYIREWAYDHNLAIKEKKKKKRTSDYEVRKWYERTRGL